ncbi:Uma2 family endonuclease [Phormidesmis sp. 146-35]
MTTQIVTPVTVPIKNIVLEPGSVLTITDITWEKFEAILEELGEKRSARIAYSNGVLEIVAPLPAHERPNRIIGRIVTLLLDARNLEWEDFGSTTFRRKKKQAGLEPDTCFYIGENAKRVRSCMMSMNLDVYPPPDLAIEADVTSKTTLEAYAGIQVPEVWIYNRGKLKINLLNDSEYQESATSLVFPDSPITQLICDRVQQAMQEGTSSMLKQLRQEMRDELVQNVLIS